MTRIAKLKILYLLTKDDLGGAQKYVTDLADHLDRNQFEPKILYGGSDVKQLSNQVLPWVFFVNDWLAIFELVRIFRRERPDIIHLNSSKAGVLGSFAAGIYKTFLRFKLPITNYQLPKVVFTAHGWVFNPTNYIAAPIRWCYVMIHRFAAYFQDAIINVSEYDRQLALHYRIAPSRKLVTIHNGIDPNMKFIDRETARKEITKKLTTYNLQLTTSNPWIGSIGRLTKEKDYGTLIAAAKLVPDAYFFIIGEGAQLSYLQLLITNYKLQNRFFIIPPTGEDSKFLKAFDVFVMPSIKEGLPYILLEAMAAGVPIVATDAGGMPEALQQYNRGRVIARRAPEALAKSIKTLRDSGDSQRKDEGASIPFTIGTMMAKTTSLYEN